MVQLCVWPERMFSVFNLPPQDDLSVVGERFSGNRLVVNCAKTKVMLFGSDKFSSTFFIIMS